MKEALVTFGETQYTIKQQRYGQARQWRQKLTEELEPIAQALNGQLGAIVADAGALYVPESAREAQAFDWAPWAGVMGQATGLLSSVGRLALSSIDTAADLLFAYSPELAAQRDQIESEAYDDQIITALIEVIKLAYPISPAMQMISSIAGRNG